MRYCVLSELAVNHDHIIDFHWIVLGNTWANKWVGDRKIVFKPVSEWLFTFFCGVVGVLKGKQKEWIGGVLVGWGYVDPVKLFPQLRIDERIIYRNGGHNLWVGKYKGQVCKNKYSLATMFNYYIEIRELTW